MIQVRSSTFETNSSSAHSLVIGKKYAGRYTPEEALREIGIDDDGFWRPERWWDEDPFYFGRAPFQILQTFTEKLRYVYAHTPVRHHPPTPGNKWGRYSYRFYVISDKLKKFLPGYAGISFVNYWSHRRFSHGNIGTDDHMLWDWLKEANVTLEEFLLNKNIMVIVDGDEYCIWSDLKRKGIVSDGIAAEYPAKQWWEEDPWLEEDTTV